MSCPFYGKGAVPGFGIFDQEGNRCALIISAHSPCVMEAHQGKPPDARHCELLSVASRWRDQIEKGDRFLVLRGSDWVEP